MKFLKLNPHHYVRYDAITEVLTQGKEGHVQVLVVVNEERLIYKHGKDFAEAERIIKDLIRELEYSDGATVLYRSDDQLATEGGE